MRGWRASGAKGVSLLMVEFTCWVAVADPLPDRRIGFGDQYGEPVWNAVPDVVNNSVVIFPDAASKFYRLRKP